MEPNSANFPILSFVMSRLAQFGREPTTNDPNSPSFDIEQPPPPSVELVSQMPRITDPKILEAMTLAVSEIAQTRLVLETLGDRPDHESVDKARSKLAELDSNLSKQLEEIVLAPRPEGLDLLQWRAQQSDKEKECRGVAEKERRMYKAVLQIDEMHEAYEKLLKGAEKRLTKIYDSVEGNGKEKGKEIVDEEVNEEVVGILEEASMKGFDRVELSGRRLRFLPEAFGKLLGLVLLDLSNNQLEVIPDSIAGLENLQELNLSSNLLESLPDSIGFLVNLKILNVSSNKLKALPDSISYCRSLVELDASFNDLTYLPTNIGFELVNLQKLSFHLNKVRSLPTSICEMKSLRHLDAQFNELRGLPPAIGKLTNLEIMNLSSNFADMQELPDTLGDLTNLRELDLSNNQIHALPDTFGRLENLTKLNLEQNPIVIPPVEIVKRGVEAVKEFMSKRWLDILVEEEQKSMVEANDDQTPTGWLTRSLSSLNTWVSTISETVTGSPRPRDPYLDQQF